MSKSMPVLFFGHGNPMNALGNNAYTQGWSAVGKALPRPRAVLSISAHYYIPFLMVTSNPNPPTIHDFSGFPKALYEVEYPAPGSPELAGQIRDLLVPDTVRFDDAWGLDHGTWSVLRHVFPEADIPVVQLSIDEKKAPGFHYEIGNRLKPLREEGVLIIGSGNIVHNLRRYSWNDPEREPFDWAVRFENAVIDRLLAGDDASLVDYRGLGPDSGLAVPTPDHYLPFLYVLGLRDENEPITFPVQGIYGGCVSMRCIRTG